MLTVPEEISASTENKYQLRSEVVRFGTKSKI